MVPVIKQLASLFVLVCVGISFSANCSLAQEAAPVSIQRTDSVFGEAASPATLQESNLSKAEGIVMLDYQVIPVSGIKPIDLMGFHLFNKMNDWLYLGVGGYAPMFKGEYGGFMIFDVTAHVQHKIVGDFFADVGISAGGGGGGKSVQQSKVLSGTGGFYKAYLGLGFQQKDFSVGANISRIKLTNSAIDHSQLNLYLQVPFSYSIGPYASSGEGFSRTDKPGTPADFSDPNENILSFGLDNFLQIKPEGTNKGTINLVDLQFTHFLSKSIYWFGDVGVGYHGLPLYNQVLAGLGARAQLSPRVHVYGQLGLGSGGYAPDTINTGSGLLVYPKVSAEYLFDKNLGVALSAGYLFAPTGSSKNFTLGAALNYHIHSGDAGHGATDAGKIIYRGYRLNLFQQTEFNVSYKDKVRSNINLLTLQGDGMINEYLYLPIQVAVAYNDYLGYPGYGELLVGIGVQNKHNKGSRFQVFGQLLVGTNVHGPILKYGLGMNYGLSDRMAIYCLAGQTIAVNKDKFKSDYTGLGVTYRFSMPSW